MGLKIGVVFLALAVIELTAAVSLEDCPASIPRDRYLRAHGESCYLFVIGHEREFSTAERECELRGGHLVIIRNAETQNWLYHTLRNEFHYRDIVWIGLSDHVTENRWVWVDGSRAQYTHWASGQPGFVGGLEDCAGMDVDDGGYWHDFRCSGFLFVSSEHYFVCEYPIVKRTTTTTTTAEPTTTTLEPPIITDPVPTTTPMPPTTTVPTTTVPTTPMPTTTVPTTQMPTTTVPTTSMPTTPVPTTPMPTTPVPTTPKPTTPVPTTPMPTITVPTTPVPMTVMDTTTGCPPFTCSLDCGLTGYQINDEGCMLCACDE